MWKFHWVFELLPLCLPPGGTCWFPSPDSERQKQQKFERKVPKHLRILSCMVIGIALYLQFLCLSPYFKQLCDGVDKPLKVMVAHLFDLPIMVPDPSIQLLHEEAMFLAIIHRPG